MNFCSFVKKLFVILQSHVPEFMYTLVYIRRITSKYIEYLIRKMNIIIRTEKPKRVDAGSIHLTIIFTFHLATDARVYCLVLMKLTVG